MNSKSFSLALAIAVLTAAAVHATTIWTYTYTGNPFDPANSTPPYTAADFVTVTMEFSAPLGNNLVAGAFGPFTFVTPLAWSFSDGINSVNNTSPSVNFSHFEVGTSATGQIASWDIYVDYGGFSSIQTSSSFGGASDTGFEVAFVSQGFNADNPGTWTISSATVPDAGSSFGLLLLSVAALGVANRQFKRAAA